MREYIIPDGVVLLVVEHCTHGGRTVTLIKSNAFPLCEVRIGGSITFDRGFPGDIELLKRRDKVAARLVRAALRYRTISSVRLSDQELEIFFTSVRWRAKIEATLVELIQKLKKLPNRRVAWLNT